MLRLALRLPLRPAARLGRKACRRLRLTSVAALSGRRRRWRCGCCGGGNGACAGRLFGGLPQRAGAAPPGRAAGVRGAIGAALSPGRLRHGLSAAVPSLGLLEQRMLQREVSMSQQRWPARRGTLLCRIRSDELTPKNLLQKLAEAIGEEVGRELSLGRAPRGLGRFPQVALHGTRGAALASSASIVWTCSG